VAERWADHRRGRWDATRGLLSGWRIFMPAKDNGIDQPVRYEPRMNDFSLMAAFSIPERFATEDKARRTQLTYFPFGAGVRQCIWGESFAWMRRHSALATIREKWKLRLVTAIEWSRSR